MEVLDPLVYRPKDLAKALGISKVTVFRMIASGRLPKPIRFGGRCVSWQKKEIEAWLVAGAPCRQDWEAIQASGKGVRRG